MSGIDKHCSLQHCRALVTAKKVVFSTDPLNEIGEFQLLVLWLKSLKYFSRVLVFLILSLKMLKG